jgi:hypothetical protein
MTGKSAFIVAAFERGWRTLLREERVTAQNIDKIAGALLIGILEAVDAGEQNEIVLMARGVHRARRHDKRSRTSRSYELRRLH